MMMVVLSPDGGVNGLISAPDGEKTAAASQRFRFKENSKPVSRFSISSLKTPNCHLQSESPTDRTCRTPVSVISHEAGSVWPVCTEGVPETRAVGREPIPGPKLCFEASQNPFLQSALSSEPASVRTSLSDRVRPRNRTEQTGSDSRNMKRSEMTLKELVCRTRLQSSVPSLLLGVDSRLATVSCQLLFCCFALTTWFQLLTGHRIFTGQIFSAV